MFNVGHLFIVMELAPLLIHVQSDDIAANTDAISFVTVGTQQNMPLQYFATLFKISRNQINKQINGKSLFSNRLHSLKVLMNPEIITDYAAGLN